MTKEHLCFSVSNSHSWWRLLFVEMQLTLFEVIGDFPSRPEVIGDFPSLNFPTPNLSAWIITEVVKRYSAKMKYIGAAILFNACFYLLASAAADTDSDQALIISLLMLLFISLAGVVLDKPRTDAKHVPPTWRFFSVLCASNPVSWRPLETQKTYIGCLWSTIGLGTQTGCPLGVNKAFIRPTLALFARLEMVISVYGKINRS